MTESMNWMFGRGLSMSCNLTWAVPPEWSSLDRSTQITSIKADLEREMNRPEVDTSVIQKYLHILEHNTSNDWTSRFITTNWDYLLQREIQALKLADLPSWMTNSHVFHLNGTVEELEDNSNRSHFLLEEDPASMRCFTPEANIVYNAILMERTFIVVGMSFECETDKFLLTSLNRYEDDLPIGESRWIVINPDSTALQKSCQEISRALPNGEVIDVCSGFNEWLDGGLQELQNYGAITFS